MFLHPNLLCKHTIGPQFPDELYMYIVYTLCILCVSLCSLPESKRDMIMVR